MTLSERPTLCGIVSRFRPSVAPLRQHIAGKRAVDHGVHVDLLHGDDRFPQLGIGVTLVGDAVAPVRGQVSGVRMASVAHRTPPAVSRPWAPGPIPA